MATLLQLHFSFNGPFGDTMAEQLKPLAESINQEPGFLWKVWTESEKNHEAGGIYLFSDEKSALTYLEKHTARLKNLGVEEVVAKSFRCQCATESNQSGKTCLTDFNQGRLVPFSSLSEISQILKISTKLT